jgi:hypothetical protein
MEQPQQRDIVYCHQCENEWYRDEGGLTCPDCQSDFTEIVEGGNDPRAQGDDHDLPGAENSTLQRMLDTSNNHPLQDHDPWNAPDPDEDDIDHFQWERAAQPGQFHASFNRTYNLDGRGQAPGQGAGAGAGGGGLLGMIGNMVGGLLQQPQQGQQQPGQGQEHEHDHTRGRSQEEGRDAHASTPGSPNAGEQQEQSGRPGTFTRHVHGPGYSFTMTATTASNLSPRNANNPQPFNAQPQDMDDLMQQMFNNIGGFPPLMPGQDPRQNQQPRHPRQRSPRRCSLQPRSARPHRQPAHGDTPNRKRSRPSFRSRHQIPPHQSNHRRGRRRLWHSRLQHLHGHRSHRRHRHRPPLLPLVPRRLHPRLARRARHLSGLPQRHHAAGLDG